MTALLLFLGEIPTLSFTSLANRWATEGLFFKEPAQGVEEEEEEPAGAGEEEPAGAGAGEEEPAGAGAGEEEPAGAEQGRRSQQPQEQGRRSQQEQEQGRRSQQQQETGEEEPAAAGTGEESDEGSCCARQTKRSLLPISESKFYKQRKRGAFTNKNVFASNVCNGSKMHQIDQFLIMCF